MRHTYLDRCPRSLVGLVIFTLLLVWPVFARGQETHMTCTKPCISASEQDSSITTAVIAPAVIDSARTTLENAWDDTSAYQHERAYCVTSYTQYGYVSGEHSVDIRIDVSAVEPAHVDSSGTQWAAFACPPGQPELHTHPPMTCNEAGTACELGGIEAFECFPSRNDLLKLIGRGDDWAIIQCDRHDFRFFYPFELRPVHAEPMAGQPLPPSPEQ